MLSRIKITQHIQPLSSSVDVADPVWMAWRTMKEHKVKQLPVVKAGKIVGIVSDKDILRISGFNGGQSMPVKEAMSLDPLLVKQDASMQEVLESMLKKDLEYAVVVNKSGQIKGLFTWNNAVEFVLQLTDINKLQRLLSS